ncbi:uncharacterized protein LOC114256775 [Camellia sinensis]|uniref:uncharacterized protein LOC114256775 n=1 Tax=Camellia sinensis TaxID=4442 RepID=UPI001035CCC1|nr:uncharacterized protein LOC114256775 [Camellia sinensis]
MAIVNKMWIHGDKTEDVTIVEKILQSLTPKFNFVVRAIEEANDVSLLSIDDLQKLIEDEEEVEVKEEEVETTMIVGNKIISIKRVNFKEKEEDEEATTQQLIDQSQQTSPRLNVTDVIDTGCSNHMCGDKKAFSDLDESFRNTVKFGDNSTVSVMGKGRVTIQTKGNSTHIISHVLFVPNLKTNLLTVGQLQEKGYEISIKDGVCQIQDAKLGLIARVNMTANRMFLHYLHNTNHSCFSAKLKDEAWL